MTAAVMLNMDKEMKERVTPRSVAVQSPAHSDSHGSMEVCEGRGRVKGVVELRFEVAGGIV
jgi:hypothetical protein